MRYRSIFLTAVAAVGILWSGSAQEHKRVEVTTIYNPEIATAEKLAAPASIDDTPVMEPEINYYVVPDTWQITLADHNFRPATASYWDFDRARKFFARVGVGYELGSDVALSYLTQNKRLGYGGFSVEHNGMFARKRSAEGVLRPISRSYDMDNHVAASGGLFVGRYMLEGVFDYHNDIYNRYAEVVTPARLYSNDAALTIRFGDDFVDLSRINFAVMLNGGYWHHELAEGLSDGNIAAEYRFGGDVRVARSFEGNKVEIMGGYDMVRGLRLYDYGNTRFQVGVGYGRKFGFVAVDASVGYMYDKVRNLGKASHYVMPRVNVQFDFGLTEVVPYVEVDTKVARNSLSHLYRVNPYIDFEGVYDRLFALPNTLSYNVAVGVKGTAFSSRLSYHAYVGADFMHDKLMWYITTPGCFGVHADKLSRVLLGAEVMYKPVGGLDITATVYGHIDFTESPYVTNEPRFNAELKARYTLRRLAFYVGCEAIGKRLWSYRMVEGGVTPDDFVSRQAFDLRAGVSFRATKRIEAYVDVYNILNDRDIYDYAFYYRNGVGFMAGAKFNF